MLLYWCVSKSVSKLKHSDPYSRPGLVILVRTKYDIKFLPKKPFTKGPPMTFFEKKFTQVEKHKGPPYVSGYILVSDTFARFWLSPVSVSFGISDSPVKTELLRREIVLA